MGKMINTEQNYLAYRQKAFYVLSSINVIGLIVFLIVSLLFKQNGLSDGVYPVRDWGKYNYKYYGEEEYSVITAGLICGIYLIIIFFVAIVLHQGLFLKKSINRKRLLAFSFIFFASLASSLCLGLGFVNYGKILLAKPRPSALTYIQGGKNQMPWFFRTSLLNDTCKYLSSGYLVVTGSCEVTNCDTPNWDCACFSSCLHLPVNGCSIGTKQMVLKDILDDLPTEDYPIIFDFDTMMKFRGIITKNHVYDTQTRDWELDQHTFEDIFKSFPSGHSATGFLAFYWAALYLVDAFEQFYGNRFIAPLVFGVHSVVPW